MTKEFVFNDNFYHENKKALFDYNNFSMMKYRLDKIKNKINDVINFLNNRYSFKENIKHIILYIHQVIVSMR